MESALNKVLYQVHWLLDEAEYHLMLKRRRQGITALDDQLQQDAAHQYRTTGSFEIRNPIVQICLVCAGILAVVVYAAMLALMLGSRLRPGWILQSPPPLALPAHVEFPIDNLVLSLSRAAPRYSLPWLQSWDPPIAMPTRHWAWHHNIPALQDIQPCIDAIVTSAQDFCYDAKRINFQLLEIHLPAIQGALEVGFDATSSPTASIWQTRSSKTRMKATWVWVLSEVAMSLQNVSVAEPEFRPQYVMDTSRALQDAVDTALNASIRSIATGKGPQSQHCDPTTIACFDIWEPAIQYLRTVHNLRTFMDLNMFVMEQRLSALRTFAKQLLSEVKRAQSTPAPPSSDIMLQFLRALESAAGKGKKSELVTLPNRAALLTSKFWAHHQEAQATRISRNLNIWARQRLDDMLSLPWWRSAGQADQLQAFKKLFWCPLPSSRDFAGIYEPVQRDWNGETPLVSVREARGYIDEEDQIESIDEEEDEAAVQGFAALLEHRGFRSTQKWDRYKPRLNGESCLILPSLPDLRLALHIANSPVSWRASTATPSAAPPYFSTVPTSARQFVEAYQTSQSWFSESLYTASDIFCIDIPWVTEQPGTDTRAPSPESSSIWDLHKIIGVHLSRQEKLVWNLFRDREGTVEHAAWAQDNGM